MKPIVKAAEIAERFKAEILAKLAKLEARRLRALPPAARATQEPPRLPGLFNQASKDTGELYLYDAIGDYGGITASDVMNALAGMDPATKALNVFINSPGGDVWEAKTIHANLLRFKAGAEGRTVNVNVDGIAASAATFIAMAGDVITTVKAGTWMVHEAECLAYGRAEDLETAAAMVRKENDTIAKAYADQTGGSVAEMLELMSATTWMTADEALAKGFTDKVKDPDEDDDNEDDDDTDGDSEDMSASSVIRIAVSTDQLIRDARQRRRIEQLSARASPAPRDGKPPRITPQPTKETPR